jgi:hypothetical protein
MSTDPKEFYTQRIPAQFGEALRRQAETSTNDGGESSRILEEMRAVNATLRIIVKGETEDIFHLNISAGKAEASDVPAHAPFMTIIHDIAALDALVRESGDSALGFLGGMAGLAGEMKLTSARIANLADLQGSIGLELTGEDGFRLVSHFGPDPIPDEPNCTIRIDGSVYQDIRSGALPAQEAFMTGRIEVEGDMQMAMQLALAALSPD